MMSSSRRWPSRTLQLYSLPLLSWTLLVLSLCYPAASAAPAKGIDMHAGKLLNGENFNETIADGIWLVEHYSPYCHHCRSFAPTWIELANSRANQAKTINFHFGQVDCSVDGDLCDANGVKGYPSVFLYENGEFAEQFKKERTLEILNKWLDARLPDDPTTQETLTEGTGTEDAAVPQPAIIEEEVKTTKASQTVSRAASELATTSAAVLPTNTIKAEEKPLFQTQKPEHVFDMRKRVTPNPDGTVQAVSQTELESYIAADSKLGPTFVKYYAPWCGHCKHLAPTWVELAEALRGKINVLEYNCDAKENSAKCRAEKIQGYPTLMLYHEGEKIEYNGARKLDDMQEWALKAAATAIEDVPSASSLASVISSNPEIFFLYLHPASTPVHHNEMVETASRTLLGFAPIYKSSAPEVFSNLHYPTEHPALLVFKDGESRPVATYNMTVKATSTSGDAADDRKKVQEEVVSFLHSAKFPTMTELTGANFKAYFEDLRRLSKDPYVVLTAFSKKGLGPAKFASYREDFHKIAKAWNKGIKFSPKDRPVSFVWVDGDSWAKYLAQTYSLPPNAPEPRIVIAEPAKHKYYPLDAKKQMIAIDGRQVFAALESLYDNKLKPYRSISFGDRVVGFLMRYLGWIFVAMGNHPIISVLVGAASFVVCFCVLVYMIEGGVEDSRPSAVPGMSEKPAHQPKYVNNGGSLYGNFGNDNGVKKD